MKLKTLLKKVKTTKNISSNRCSFEILEPRILLSADAFGVGFDDVDKGFDDYPHDFSDEDFVGELKQKLSDHVRLQSSESLIKDSALFKASEHNPLNLDEVGDLLNPSAEPAQHELIIIDSQVPNIESLLDSIQLREDTHYTVRFIAQGEEGVVAATNIIDDYQNLSAVHIISHGSAGALQLGSTELNISSVDNYLGLFSNWQNHTTDDADLLIYACDFAGNENGQAVAQIIAEATSMDVAASMDLTGHQILGGDWDLEYEFGQLQTNIALDETLIAQWQNALATIIVNDNGDRSLDASIDSVSELLSTNNNGTYTYTLREALEAIEKDRFLNSTVHTIAFELADNTITVSSTALQSINTAVNIDGTTDSDYVDAPVITINGVGDVLTINASYVTIEGLILTGSTGLGLNIQGDNNIVIGNYIHSVGESGIRIDGDWNTIGGTTADARNVISNNGDYGIIVEGSFTDHNTISGNYIGTNAAGDTAWGNNLGGIRIYNSASYLTIGGTADGAGNLISGNGDEGISIGQSSHNVDIINNYIGVAADGESDLGNNGHGIRISTASGLIPGTYSDVTVQGNVIAFNAGDGINVDSTTAYGALFTENLIHSNDQLSIDLNDDGNTANDLNDFDAGANYLNNYPVLTNVEIDAVDNEVRISGSVNYNYIAAETVTLHFYYADNETGTGYGEADGYIGSYDLALNFTGSSSFVLDFATAVPDNSYISATVTRDSGTSEMSDTVFLVNGNFNYQPTGAVTIAGTLIQGAMLTASNTIADGNNISTTINYQWRRNGTDISGATSDTYTLTQSDVGEVISVVASYTDDDGYSHTVTSDDTTAISNLNDDPTGTVTITGTAEEDQTLSAAHTISDDDGTSGSTFTFQWYRDGVAIAGETGTDYTLTDTDVGAVIRVDVSYTDDEGTDETVSSNNTATVANINDVATGTVTITGAATEDETLSATHAITDDDGTSTSTFSYQWYRDGVAISGATNSTYTLSDADVGAVIRADVSFTDDNGGNETISSGNTTAITNVNDVATGTVTITGTAEEDQTLTASQTITDDDGTSTSVFDYQWYRDGVAIAGATNSTYTLGDDDVGAVMRVDVSFTDDKGGSETLSSANTTAVANINDAPTGTVTIAGTPQEDETLTANHTIADDDGTTTSTFTYQWYRDGVAISGATATQWTLTQDDVGAEIHVAVSYTDDKGSSETSNSNTTAVVANVNDGPIGNVTITGIEQEDQTLQANPGFTDEDGIAAGALNYQWRRDGADITGAVDATYTLGDEDVGAAIDVVVTYVDEQGTTETVTSASTAAIANVNDDPVGQITIVGTTDEDEILSVNLAFTDNDGLPSSFAYQWFRDGVALGGETNATYQLSDADVGAVVHVTVEYVDEQGTTELLTSTATATIGNVNDLPQGTVTIDGVATEDQTLTAEIAFTDADGLPSEYSYQWFRDGASIADASLSTYTLGDEDVGSLVHVVVTYTDGQGTLETVSSATLGAIANVNDMPTGSITLTGTGQENETLTFINSIADADGLPANYQYQWLRDGADILGATQATYTVVDDDVGKDISLRLVYVDEQGTTESVVSDALTATNTNDSPIGNITIAGTPIEDQTLTAELNFTDDDGLPSQFNYQWYRNNTLVNGANDASYQLGDADVGSNVHVVVTYVDNQGTTETVTSGQSGTVANVNDSAIGEVVIVGNATEDQTLTANVDVADADGLPTEYSYQWYRNNLVIDGATNQTYVLGDDDVGASIYVQVSFVDGNGTTETFVSAATNNVANVNDAPLGSVDITGEASEDQTLTAIKNFTDNDGLPASSSYQWFRDGVAITGAVDANYTLSDDDVGAVISVEVTYQDNNGTTEVVQSTATAIIANVNDAPTGNLTIVGEAIEDQTLSVTVALEDADSIATDFAYQWYRGGEVIDGAIAQDYTLVAADGEQNITVAVSYVDGHGNAEQVVAVPTGPVTVVNHAPSGSVNLTGTAVVGSQLNVAENIVDQDGITNLQLQWLRDGDPIPGANGTSYILTLDDLDKTIAVLATYVDDKGFEEVVLSNLAEVSAAIYPELDTDIKTENLNTTDNDSNEEPEEEPSSDSEEAVTGPNESSPAFDEHNQEIKQRGQLDSRDHTSAFDQQDEQHSLAGLTIEVDHDSNNLSVVYTATELSTAGFNTVIPSLKESLSVISNSNFNRDLEQAVENMHKDSVTLTTAIVGGTTAVSTGLSVGYVIWTLRSSILVTSLLSSMPAWRFIDPLPILSTSGEEGEEDDESLESLVGEDNEPAQQRLEA